MIGKGKMNTTGRDVVFLKSLDSVKELKIMYLDDSFSTGNIGSDFTKNFETTDLIVDKPTLIYDANGVELHHSIETEEVWFIVDGEKRNFNLNLLGEGFDEENGYYSLEEKVFNSFSRRNFMSILEDLYDMAKDPSNNSIYWGNGSDNRDFILRADSYHDINSRCLSLLRIQMTEQVLIDNNITYNPNWE